MRLEKLVLTVVLVLCFAIAATAGEMPKIVGVYEKVPGKEFSFDGKTVEIIEFLSFYCGHCYNFERAIPVIKGNFPGKITWKVVPMYWGKGSSRPGEAYLLAEEAGKGEKMKKALFDSLFREQKDISSFDVIEEIAASIGLGFDFSRRLRSGEKEPEIRKAFKMLKEYGVVETPTLIIAGNIRVSPGMLNNSTDLMRDNTIAILKSLFRK
jgi:thiol:disulfide interchange protein DsbA